MQSRSRILFLGGAPTSRNYEVTGARGVSIWDRSVIGTMIVNLLNSTTRQCAGHGIGIGIGIGISKGKLANRQTTSDCLEEEKSRNRVSGHQHHRFIIIRPLHLYMQSWPVKPLANSNVHDKECGLVQNSISHRLPETVWNVVSYSRLGIPTDGRSHLPEPSLVINRLFAL